ncbi:hypothetical protein ACQJBY_007262 [Aegilops geniculata]
MLSVCWVLRVIMNKEHVYPFKFTDVVTTTTHVPPRTKGGHDLLQVFGDVRREAGRADGDGALRQDHGAAQEAQLWAQPGAPRPRARSASGYTWASPPASSTSSPPRSPPPSLTMPPYIPSFDLSLPFRSVPFPLTALVFVCPGLTYVRVWFFCSSRRGLLCPTFRQVEIVCVALVNREHSGRKLKD